MTEQKYYIKQTGTINYLATGIRPDIAYTVSKLYEGNTKPSDSYLVVLKYLYKYLETTKSIGLLLSGKYKMDNLGLKTYGDASFADDLLTRHSTGAHMVFLIGSPVF